MASNEAKLLAVVDANTKSLENALKRLEVISAGSFERQARSAAKLDTTLSGIGRQATAVGSQIASVGKTFAAAFGVGVLTGGLAQLPGLFADAAKRAGDLADAADRIGVSVKSLQELRFAAGQSGVEIGELDDALQRFSKNVGEAASGSGDLLKILQANGVALRDASGKLRPLDDLLDDYAQLVRNAASASDRLVLATKAFGRGGAGMVNILADGKAGLDAFRGAAEKAGVVLGEDGVRKLAAFDDRLQELQGRFGNFKDQAIVAALEVLEAIGRIEHGIADEISKALDQNAEELAKAAGTKAGHDIAGRPIVKRVDEAFKEIGGIVSAIDPGDLKAISDAAEKAAHPITKLGDAAGEAAAKLKAPEPIGASGAISGFVDRVVGPESGGNATAKNPNSTATGLGQFLESTWLALFKQTFPDMAKGMSDAAVLALRNDPGVSRQMIEAYAKQNAATLQAAGIAATEANLHLAHFLGPGDAIKALQAAPGTPLAGLISPASIAANPTVLGGGKTTSDAIAFANRRAAGPSSKDIEEQAQKTQDLAKAKDELVASSERETEALGLEAKSFGETTLEAEKAKEFQSLYNQAVDAGIPITTDLVEKLHQLADAHAQGVVAVDAARKAQDDLQTSQQATISQMDEFRSFSSGVLSGFISDLVHGKSASEALAGALGKIGDKLIDIASNQIIGALFGQTGTAGGGLFGSFFGGAAAANPLAGVPLTQGGLFAKGGVMTSRGPVPLRRYASGGVASTPQMAMFGEGSRPEAYVPLPDGRRIPVNLRAPRMSGPPGGRQRVDVDSRIHISPSDQFDVRVESRVRQAQTETFRAMPAYLGDQQARAAGSAR